MVQTSTLLADTIFYVKDAIQDNITDPISNRPTNQAFIMTSYPTRATTYPIITIKDSNIQSRMTLGLKSEASAFTIDVEIRIWANDTKIRDSLADDVYELLRTSQIGDTGTSQANALHDLRLLSSVNVDDPDGPKSKVMVIRYLFVQGSSADDNVGLGALTLS